MGYKPVRDGQGRAACFSSMKFYELDERTGLPKVLEKGSYFKVKKSILGRDVLEVHYMRRTGWFAFSEDNGFIHGVRDREVTQDEILFEALWTLHGVELGRIPTPKVEKVKKSKPVSQRRALGNYPPKSLKDVHPGGN